MFKLYIYLFAFLFSFSSINAEVIKPKKLQEGDTVKLITPSHQITTEQLNFAIERLEALGLNVIIPKGVLDKYGYFAGTVEDRAEEINNAFLNKDVKAIIAVRGGSGLSLVLDEIDYDIVKRNPKIVLGYSDITALLVALNNNTSLVTFHGPMPVSPFPEFTVNYLKSILFDADKVVLENINDVDLTSDLIQTEHRFYTINDGKVKGRLIGGNLTVLTNMIGSKHFPKNWTGKILFLEDVGEDIYKVDRMFAQLKNANVLDQVSGIIFGTCTNCKFEFFGGFRLAEVLERYISPLEIPAYYGAMIGHQDKVFTVPVGSLVEMDATNGKIIMLEPAVLN